MRIHPLDPEGMPSVYPSVLARPVDVNHNVKKKATKG